MSCDKFIFLYKNDSGDEVDLIYFYGTDDFLGYNYTVRFFCIDATLLCEFESDKI